MATITAGNISNARHNLMSEVKRLSRLEVKNLKSDLSHVDSNMQSADILPPSYEDVSGYPGETKPSAPMEGSFGHGSKGPHFDGNGYPQIVQVIVTDVGRTEREMVCPYCAQNITTKVRIEPAMTTHLMSMLLCLLGGVCCFWVPYCSPSCQDALHECPNCGMPIARSRAGAVRD